MVRPEGGRPVCTIASLDAAMALSAQVSGCGRWATHDLIKGVKRIESRFDTKIGGAVLVRRVDNDPTGPSVAPYLGPQDIEVRCRQCNRVNRPKIGPIFGLCCRNPDGTHVTVVFCQARLHTKQILGKCRIVVERRSVHVMADFVSNNEP